MKNRLLIVFILFTAFMFSCRDDWEYVESQVLCFATAYTDSNGHIEVLKDDMGNEYMVYDDKWELERNSAFRVICTFTLSDKNVATIHNMFLPLTSNAVDEELIPVSQRTKDPLDIRSAYIGSGYMNLVLDIKVRNEESQHSLLPVCIKSDSLLFTIYHDAGGETGVYTKTAYLCIPLADYGLCRNDTVFLKCNGYEEDCEMSLIYR